MYRIIAIAALAVILHLSAGQISFAQTPAQIVKERQDGMEKMWPDFYQAIARTLRIDSPDLAFVAATAPKAAEHVKKLATLFPPGTGREAVPTTRAKPEIWTQRAEFDGALTAMIDATNAMGAAAKSGDVAKVKAEWTNFAKACGTCHGGPEKSGGKFRFEEE
ncbi:MAG: cytochrome c [Pseudolabrys sp.]